MRTIVTHNGAFHADDVFAVAAFMLAHQNEEWEVVRSRERDDFNQGDAVLDVGGKYDPSSLRFDHHQEGTAGERENGIRYAAFGLVWKEFGEKICKDSLIADQIEENLVMPIDAHDNGQSLCEERFGISPFEISYYVKIQNLTWKEEEELGDKADEHRLQVFLSLVEFAKGLILRQIKRNGDKNMAIDFVTKAYESALDKRVIVFDRFYPWQDVLLKKEEPLFVVYPNLSGRYGSWAAKTVPTREHTFESRSQFPESWAGKRDEELQAVTGIADAIFCHNARFIAVAGSKEGILSLVSLALESRE